MLTGLQALRFLAALAILIFHTLHYAPTPLTLYALNHGVTVFFALSGFLMAMVLENTTLSRFIIHRLLRIYPAFLVAVALVVSAQTLILGDSPPFDVRILTLAPIGESVTPLRVEWSLVYEVVFYGIVAVLSLVPRNARHAIVATWGAAIAIGTQLTSINLMWPRWFDILLSPLNLGFIFGMTAWWQREHIRIRPGLLICIAAAITAARYPAIASAEPSTIAMPLAAAILVLAASQMQFRAFHQPIIAAGNASYGIYLLHAPLILLLMPLFQINGWPGLGFVGVTALAAGIIFGLLEHRVYEAGRDFLDRRYFKRRPDAQDS